MAVAAAAGGCRAPAVREQPKGVGAKMSGYEGEKEPRWEEEGF